MRPLFTLLLVVFCSHSYASNDTLTRAEVYNFSVGDTFDYRNYGYSYCDPFEGNYSDSSTSYSRYIVSKIYWSTDSSTKSIVRKIAYPSPEKYDTINLSNLRGFEVIMDTIWFNRSFAQNYYTIDSLPDYFNEPTNFIIWFCCTPGWEYVYFAKGLGKVTDVAYGGALGCGSSNSIVLIYYSGSNGIYGEPYTLFPSVVENLALNNEPIKVYPTLNNGTFTIETPTPSQLPLNFFVYDLQGRIVRKLVLNQNKMEVNLQQLSGGVYIWKAGCIESIFATGKIVVE